MPVICKQNLEQYQEVSGKEEEKFDKAVEVQNKEKICLCR